MIRRNLICHIYPRSAGGHWRRTVERLLQAWGQFDGRKIVAIATDSTTDDPESVQLAFNRPGIEFLIQPNNRHLQETATFQEMLPRIIDEPGATFYCHAKGCTHSDPGSASHLWREAMADVCLNYPALTGYALERFGTAGAFRSDLPFGWGTGWAHPWHWAGTWWWARNEDLRQRDWRRIEPALWGVEAYAGQQFRLEESGCLFWPCASTAHLYDPAYWQRWLTPALNRFKARLAGCNSQGTEAA